MSIIYLILLVGMVVFIISSFVGLFRFLRDTKKYSSYYQELKDLKEKAEKQVVYVKCTESESEEGKNDEADN